MAPLCVDIECIFNEVNMCHFFFEMPAAPSKWTANPSFILLTSLCMGASGPSCCMLSKPNIKYQIISPSWVSHHCLRLILIPLFPSPPVRCALALAPSHRWGDEEQID